MDERGEVSWAHSNVDVRKRLMEKEGLLKKKRGERKEEREGGSNMPEMYKRYTEKYRIFILLSFSILKILI